jgi:hypothetical protein
MGSFGFVLTHGLACQKPAFDRAIIRFFMIFKMGSFGKNSFFIQGLSDTSNDNGGGTASPSRLLCKRSNWFMARSRCRTSWAS